MVTRPSSRQAAVVRLAAAAGSSEGYDKAKGRTANHWLAPHFAGRVRYTVRHREQVGRQVAHMKVLRMYQGRLERAVMLHLDSSGGL